MLILIVFIFSFVFYLALTAGSGNILFWSYGELLLGALLSIVATLLVSRMFRAVNARPGTGFLNPVRWVSFIAYVCGPLFYRMALANFDVAKRVITGKIRPGIVRIPSGLKTDLGLALLANSITLTPGTLAVDTDGRKNIYVHMLHVADLNPETSEVCSDFPEWIRRISE
jgi:multicomponent Na+:H+ antiporter subunit E